MDPKLQADKPKTPGAMNWEQSVEYFIGKGRISRAAIFDFGGKPLAATPDVQISDQDARALQKCVSIPIDVYHRTNFGIFLGQVRYICFKVDNRTLIGLKKEELFVAHLCDNVMIVAFVPIDTEATVSCLGEVWTFAQELKSHIEVKQFVE